MATLTTTQSRLAEVISERPAYKRSVKSTPDCPELIVRNVLSTDANHVELMRSVDAVCNEQGCDREAAVMSVLPRAAQ